jgi:hypothetical protein
MWHGGKTDTSADWISMRVPDGDDWIEYMCNVQNATPKTRGIMNYVAFGVPEMEAAARTLQSRQAPMPEKPKLGRDGRRPRLRPFCPSTAARATWRKRLVSAPSSRLQNAVSGNAHPAG